MENEEGKAQATLRRFGEIDWDFPAQSSESAFSAIHWHPCRFPSQIPALTIGRLSAPGDLILDMFMGSATTLVEAQRLGRPAIGIDLNPVSCLLGRAKTIAGSHSEISGALTALRTRILGSWEDIVPAELPPSVQGSKWYMPTTISDLRRLWTITQEAEGISSIIAKASFSSILLSACREDRHWGYICDNTQPKSDRAPDARDLFLAALRRLGFAYEQRLPGPKGGFPECIIVNDDAVSALSQIPNDCVDCVITSPPYFGVADYVKAQRLTMEWADLAIEPIRRLEIGARSKRHRQNALDEYLSDLDTVFHHVYRVMKSNSTAVIVFGQSPSRPDAETRFIDNLTCAGFSIDLMRRRNIPVGRRQMPSVINESVLVLRK